MVSSPLQDTLTVAAEALSLLAAVTLGGISLLVLWALTWAALSPLETIGWWAGWFDNDADGDAVPAATQRETEMSPVRHYVLFLSGVGSASSQTMSFRERKFLAHLAQNLPHSVILDNIFPFAVNNQALTEHPRFARLWRWALHCKRHGPRIFGKLINLRNIFQICTSIDARYGPLYNRAIARTLVRLLARHGYQPERAAPVMIVASSGAAQIALGAVPYLKEAIAAPVHVITIGGVFGSDPGLLAVDHFYHLYGTRDTTVPWGWLDSRRWPIRSKSAWNRALAEGRVSRVPMPGVRHNGPRGYLDFHHPLPGEPTQVEQTAMQVAALIRHYVPTTGRVAPFTAEKVGPIT